MVLETCFDDKFISLKAGTNVEKKKIYEKVKIYPVNRTQ